MPPPLSSLLLPQNTVSTPFTFPFNYDNEHFNIRSIKELGKNALSRLCGMQKTASLNFCTPCEFSWGNAFFPGP